MLPLNGAFGCDYGDDDHCRHIARATRSQVPSKTRRPADSMLAGRVARLALA